MRTAVVPKMRPWRCGLRCLKTGKHVPRVTWKVPLSDKTHLDSITISHPTYLCQLITVLDSRLEIIFKSDCTYDTWDSWRTITDLTVDEACHTCLWEIRRIIKHIFHFGGVSQQNLSFIFHNSQSYTRHHKERERIMRRAEAKPSLGLCEKMFLTMMGR